MSNPLYYSRPNATFANLSENISSIPMYVLNQKLLKDGYDTIDHYGYYSFSEGRMQYCALINDKVLSFWMAPFHFCCGKKIMYDLKVMSLPSFAGSVQNVPKDKNYPKNIKRLVLTALMLDHIIHVHTASVINYIIPIESDANAVIFFNKIKKVIPNTESTYVNINTGRNLNDVNLLFYDLLNDSNLFRTGYVSRFKINEINKPVLDRYTKLINNINTLYDAF